MLWGRNIPRKAILKIFGRIMVLLFYFSIYFVELDVDVFKNLTKSPIHIQVKLKFLSSCLWLYYIQDWKTQWTIKKSQTFLNHLNRCLESSNHLVHLSSSFNLKTLKCGVWWKVLKMLVFIIYCVDVYCSLSFYPLNTTKNQSSPEM